MIKNTFLKLTFMLRLAVKSSTVGILTLLPTVYTRLAVTSLSGTLKE